MFNKIKNLIRILFDPTMFKYNSKYMEEICASPCKPCLGNRFTNDIIVLFKDDCLRCGDLNNIEENVVNHDMVGNGIAKVYNSIFNLKDVGFENKMKKYNDDKKRI